MSSVLKQHKCMRTLPVVKKITTTLSRILVVSKTIQSRCSAARGWHE